MQPLIYLCSQEIATKKVLLQSIRIIECTRGRTSVRNIQYNIISTNSISVARIMSITSITNIEIIVSELLFIKIIDIIISNITIITIIIITIYIYILLNLSGYH